VLAHKFCVLTVLVPSVWTWFGDSSQTSYVSGKRCYVALLRTDSPDHFLALLPVLQFVSFCQHRQKFTHSFFRNFKFWWQFCLSLSLFFTIQDSSWETHVLLAIKTTDSSRNYLMMTWHPTFRERRSTMWEFNRELSQLIRHYSVIINHSIVLSYPIGLDCYAQVIRRFASICHILGQFRTKSHDTELPS
jgi:hypothetical protein